MDRRARFTSVVEPVAGCDAASLVRSERGPIVRMRLQCLYRLHVGDGTELRTVRGLRSFPGRIAAAKLERIDSELAREHVQSALRRKRRDGRSRGPVGGRLGTVAYDVITHRAHVLEGVRRERAHARVQHRGTRKRTRLKSEGAVRRSDPSVPGRSQPDSHRRPGRGPGRHEDLLAGHRELDGTAALAGEGERDRFEVDHRLAAESPANLRWRDPQVRERKPEQPGGECPDLEMSLARAPDLGLAVLTVAGDARMRARCSPGGRAGS